MVNYYNYYNNYQFTKHGDGRRSWWNGVDNDEQKNDEREQDRNAERDLLAFIRRQVKYGAREQGKQNCRKDNV